MFKEILQVVPKLSAGDLNAMEGSLNSRFTRVAKRFGKGLLGALTGGGIAGVALDLVNKILNPLKETQDAIDRVLKQGDDIVTNAKQFGTTAGKLFRLQQLGKSVGLDPESLNVLLEKFQGAVVQATQDPNKETSVRAYVGSKDMADAFFEFIQSLQKMNKTQQVLVQQDVFGEKQILRMAQFLQTDFGWQQMLLGGPKSSDMTAPLEKLEDVNNFKNVLAAHREMNDVIKKSGEINAAMVRSQDEQEKLALDRENKQIQSYQSLAEISIAATMLTDLVKDVVLKVTDMLVRLTDLTNNVKRITGSRAVKGILKMVGDK